MFLLVYLKQQHHWTFVSGSVQSMKNDQVRDGDDWQPMKWSGYWDQRKESLDKDGLDWLG